MSIIERAMQRDAAGKKTVDPECLAVTSVEENVAVPPTLADGEADSLALQREPVKDDAAFVVKSSPSEAPSEASDLAFVQSVNFALMRRQGLLVPDDGRSVLAEEFRILKRPVLANAFNDSGQRVGRRNVVMVTSALPGEGKTYTAINLAMSIATELQRTVLLVDADVVKPSIPARLGLSVGKGLIDLLEHPEADLADFLVRTNIPNLVVLGAGSSHGRSTELLASAAMASLVSDLATRYADRLVLFDSPPMLATSESSVLARHMGQVVLAVQAGTTPRSAVSRVVRMLDACDIVIPVLNRTTGIPGMNYAMGYYLDGKYGRQ